MKKFTVLLLIMVFAVCQLMAQAPQKFTYQAVVRNASNQLVTNTLVGVRISILQNSANGSVVYSETQMLSTNANGLITLNIGEGNVVFGNISTIDWGNGIFFLRSEIDPAGGSNYSISSTQQLLSVPYALFANEAGNGFSGDYNDLTNRPQIPQSVGELTNDANYITLEQVPAQVNADWNAASGVAEILNKPTIPTVPSNVSAFNNDAGYLSGYTETDPQFNAWDKDYNDLTNRPQIPQIPADISAFNNDVPYLTAEQQILSISNDTIFLTGGSFVKLPEGFSGDYNALTNLPQIPQSVGELANDANYITLEQVPAQVNADWNAASGVAEILNKPTIPTVPTNVSAFNNDAGYLSGYTETDPQFNAWDKDYNDLTNRPQIPQIPADISAFNNDVPYLTAEQQILSISNDTIFLTGGSFVKLPEGFDGDYNSLTNTPDLNQLTDSVMNIILIMQQQWEAQQEQWQQQQMQMQQQIDSLNEQFSQIPHTENTTWNTSVTNETVCDSLVWHGETYTESGVYLYGWTDAEGINNMEALNLTVHNPVAEIVEATACEAYTWNGATFTESGDYQQTFTAASGCDSVVTLHLTIYYNSHNVFAADTCESYAWNGQTYTESGTYTYAYSNAEGCSSVDTLHLTIYHGTHNVETVTACETYTWHDSTYTQSGVYTYAYDNDHGCTSEDTLYLTVHYGTHNVETENACGSYEWHGQTYNESGTFTYAYNNEDGCPSADTLKVVVVIVDEKSCSLAPCVTDVDGNLYSTVQIGGQCWMRSNLRATHFPDGTSILYGGNDNPWSNTEPYYYEYSNCFTLEQRGYAYNWLAMTHGENSSDTSTIGIQGICPDGWHVPTNEEWTQLTDYISAQNNYICDNNNTYIAKALASNTAYWGNSNGTCPCCPSINQNENNATGFNAVPAASYYACYYTARFWSSSFISDRNLYDYRIIQSNEPVVKSLSSYNIDKRAPHAVRCVYDISACGTEFEGTHNVETDTTCDSYTWHGQTYTESGTYTYAYQNIYGCPSEDTLKLTVYQGCTIDEKSCPGTPIMMDIDSNIYSTVQIGDQCWMRSNLRTTRYADGTAVPAGNSAYSETDPYYYNYENCFTLPERGYYYNWPAVMHGQPSSTTNPSEVQGICPDGWHVPSELEWKQMTDYLANKSEYYCSRYDYFSAASLASNTGWTYYGGVQCAPGDNTPHNATGFSAIPVGYYQLVGRIGYASYVLYGADCTKGAYFWGSTENSADNAYYRAIDNMSSGFNSRNVSKDVGFSVRCVMNAEADSLGYTIDEKSCPGTPSVTDIDGNTYGTVQLGEQCWMRSNLRATRYADGTAVPAGSMNFSKTEPYYYDFSGQGGDGTSQYFPLSKRGYLYNWPAAMHGAASSNTNPSQVQGICPDGWHVPSNEEWTQLENYVRSQSQYVCGGGLGDNSGIAKALTSTVGWKDYHGNYCHPCYNPSANNATSFNAMPVGIYAYNGYQSATEVTWFLSSTENDSTSIHFCMLWLDGYYLGRFTEPKDKGYSVRCLRNENGGVTPPPSPCSSYHISISGDTSICSGESTTLTASEASNYSWSNGSNTVSITVSPAATTTYSVTGTNGEGCVDSASITVTVNSATSSTVSATACDSYSWNGTDYAQSGDYTVTLTAANGCDSVVTLHLTIHQSTHNIVTAEACESYTWNGQTYTQSGTYTREYTNEQGCPSTETLQLTINKGTHNVFYETAYDSYTWNEETYTESGTYTHHYTNAHGCASTETLILTIWHSTQHTVETAMACESYTWRGTSYDESGTYTDYYTTSDGISHRDTLILTILHGTHIVETVTACDSFVWHNNTLKESNIYIYPYIDENGCASADTLHLTILHSTHHVFTAEECDFFIWHDSTLTHSGTFIYYYTNEDDCASADTLFLTIHNGTHNNFTVEDCESYNWHDSTLTESGTYLYYYFNEYSCASVDTLHLIIQGVIGELVVISACEYYLWHDSLYTESGSYMYADTNGNGCLVMDTLLLTLYYGTHNVFEETTDGPYTWHGQIYTESGTYTYEYLNENDCASVDTLKLTINMPTGGRIAVDACEEYAWHGNTYYWDGTYTYEYTNAAGNPVTDTLLLTIHYPEYEYVEASVCDSYLWNGIEYASNGEYEQTLTTVYGCDSVVTLSLTIHPTNNAFTVNTNTDYNWHGGTYSESGTYTYAFTNEHGCSTVDTLYLTILENDSASAYLPCAGTPTVTDHEGNVYNTVQIGTQCWTKENMRCTTSPTTGSNLIPAWIYTSGCFDSEYNKCAMYSDRFSQDPAYGVLYNWCAAMDVYNTDYPEIHDGSCGDNGSQEEWQYIITERHRGICPQGWHVPSTDEFHQLTTYLYDSAGYLCNNDCYPFILGNTVNCIAKALADTTGWNIYDNTSGTPVWMAGTCSVGYDLSSNNASGFSALPAGFAGGGHGDQIDDYHWIFYPYVYRSGERACFYSSTSTASSGQYYFQIDYDTAAVKHQDDIIGIKGHSVRCLKD